jgi:hypothetical protein
VLHKSDWLFLAPVKAFVFSWKYVIAVWRLLLQFIKFCSFQMFLFHCLNPAVKMVHAFRQRLELCRNDTILLLYEQWGGCFHARLLHMIVFNYVRCLNQSLQRSPVFIFSFASILYIKKTVIQHLVIWNCSKYAPTYFGRKIAILRKKRIKPAVLSSYLNITL